VPASLILLAVESHPMELSVKPTIGKLYLFPFAILFISLFCIPTDIENSSGRSVFEQLILVFIYLFAMLLVIRQPTYLKNTLRRGKPLILLYLLVLASSFWSAYPTSVVIGFIHKTGIFFIAMCAALLLLKDSVNFYRIALNGLFIYFIATLLIIFLKPDIGVMGSGRWKGLTSHPNTLGVICLVQTWIIITSFFVANRYTNYYFFYCILALVITSICLLGTDSMTSILLSIILILTGIWKSFTLFTKGYVKVVNILFLMLMLVTSVAIVFFFNSELFTSTGFYKGIGRDSTMTGRAILWALAFKGIDMHPYLGWSFDTLRSFLNQYPLPVDTDQVHNGYLDILVRGGIISLLVFFLLVIQMYSNISKLEKRKRYIFLSSIITILIHNISESSILRDNNLLWLCFMIVYFYSLNTNLQPNFSDNK